MFTDKAPPLSIEPISLLLLMLWVRRVNVALVGNAHKGNYCGWWIVMSVSCGASKVLTVNRETAPLAGYRWNCSLRTSRCGRSSVCLGKRTDDIIMAAEKCTNTYNSNVIQTLFGAVLDRFWTGSGPVLGQRWKKLVWSSALRLHCKNIKKWRTNNNKACPVETTGQKSKTHLNNNNRDN